MNTSTITAHAHAMDTVWMTSRGVRKLQAELNLLKRTASELQHDIRQATLDFEEERRSEKRLEQQVIQSKLSRLEGMLQRVRPVNAANSAAAIVGSLVTYRQDKTTQTIRLVSSWEADPTNGRISFRSPLGAALAGKHAGDVAYMVTPVGEKKFQIVEVK